MVSPGLEAFRHTAAGEGFSPGEGLLCTRADGVFLTSGIVLLPSGERAGGGRNPSMERGELEFNAVGAI